MGYSEVRCQLCGTSFNIGRIRKAGEPRSAAFSFAEQAFLPEVNFVNKECIRRDRCPPEAGCSNIKTTRRCKLEGKIKVKADFPDVWLVRDGDEEDMDWEYKSDEDDEILEWEEDIEDDDLDFADDDDKCILSPEQSASIELELLHATKNTILNGDTDEESLEGESDDSDSDENFRERYRRSRLSEHIAGPGCIHHDGYNGHNISVEEMMGSGTVQCLIRKFPSWKSDTTDESWEVLSDYFLSGLGSYMQSRDAGGAKCLPIRHGIEDEIRPDDSYWNYRGEYEWDCPMPFHPACMEVFKRVSHEHFGKLNINTLGRWRWAECHYKKNPIDRRLDPALKRGLGQEWSHENGDEWLAANPVLVPSLLGVLRPAIVEDGAPFSENSSAFSAIRPRLTMADNPPGYAHDPFVTLPRELIYMIFTQLESPDIAALRLSSRAFTHLPIFLWKQLLRKELPWLWELWDQTDVSNWALIPSGELHEEHKQLLEAADELRERQERHKHIIKQELPECYNEYCAEHPWVLEDVDAAINSALAQRMVEMAAARSHLICKLPRDRTNWYMVYTQITRHWIDLKGLKNRERIWKSCEDIAQRIQKCIDAGKIEG